MEPRGTARVLRMVGVWAWVGTLGLVGPEAFADDVGHWTFNDGAGTTLIDSSGYGNHLTLYNGATFSTDTPQPATGNTSGYFDGGNDLAGAVDTSSLNPTGEFTLACWVKLNSLNLGDQDILISNIGPYGSSGGYQLFFHGGSSPQLGVMYRDASYVDRSLSKTLGSMNWQVDTWYHVAGTYDDTGANAELRLFVDGKPVQSGTRAGNVVYNDTPHFYLGTNYDGDGWTNANERELNGRMDEAYVFNTEETDSAIRGLATVTQTWNGGNGYAEDPTKWTIAKVPSYSSICVLPDYGAANAYTVTVNQPMAGEILDLEVNNHATVHFDGYSLTVEGGGDVSVGGKMIVEDATYTPDSSLALGGTLELDNGTIAGAVHTYDGCLIKGHGTINNSLNDNKGTIRAEGGQLSIELAGNDHDSGTLGAAGGATLLLRNAPVDNELWNKDQIALTGGTLKGSSNSMMLKNYAAGDVISGHGRIQNFNVYVGEGALTASGGQLQIDLFLHTQDYESTVNVQSGATLHVPTHSWTNNNALNLNGGSITGAMVTQDGTLSVTGTGVMQNVTFNHARTHRVENGATLRISGGGYLSDATISMGGSTGALRVEGVGAAVHGRGVIDPDVTVAQGSLYADYGGDMLRVARSLTVAASQSAYATGGATLQVDGATVNNGTIYATSGGTVVLGGEVHNANLVHANGGTVTVAGAIRAGSGGDFRATDATLSVTGPVDSGCGNTFTAHSGGTVEFAGGVSTGWFSGDALWPQGGTITLAPTGATLTHVAGKAIRGYGALLTASRQHVLDNAGKIEANGGTLAIYAYGGIFNDETLSAGNGSRLDLVGPVTNDGAIYTSGTGDVRVRSDASPDGAGTFTANAGGAIYGINGFTNADLATADALRLVGGKIAIDSPDKLPTMTNASGKILRGYGTLLEPGQVLDNQGLLEATGRLIVAGEVINSGHSIRADEPGEDIIIRESLTNHGLVDLAGGASLTAGAMSGGGRCLLAGAALTVERDLLLDTPAILDDGGIGAQVAVYGDVSNQSQASAEFAIEHTTWSVCAPMALAGSPHEIAWPGEDRGAETAGLDDNFAIGSLVLGDGLGLSGSDTFQLVPETVVYCYGLHVQADATLDLGGGTIYYLREGVEYGGITGRGLVLAGQYDNGEIIEIVPEPATLALLAFGGLMLRRRRRGR